MLGITEIINIIIIIVIIIIIFKILQTIASLITDYSAAEIIFTKPGWAFISRLLTYVLIIIIVVIIMIWIAWHFLKFISPLILGFGNLIIKIVPPFPQLEEAGIFQLLDDLFFSIVKLSPTGVFRAFITFFNNSGKFIVKSFTPSSKSTKKYKKKVGASAEYTIVDNKTTKEPTEDKTEEPDKTTEEEQRNPDATEESKYTAEEHKAVQTKMDMCIAENATPTDPMMDPIEKIKAGFNNNKVSLMCQSQSLGQYNTISKYK